MAAKYCTDVALPGMGVIRPFSEADTEARRDRMMLSEDTVHSHPLEVEEEPDVVLLRGCEKIVCRGIAN